MIWVADYDWVILWTADFLPQLQDCYVYFGPHSPESNVVAPAPAISIQIGEHCLSG